MASLGIQMKDDCDKDEGYDAISGVATKGMAAMEDAAVESELEMDR